MGWMRCCRSASIQATHSSSSKILESSRRSQLILFFSEESINCPRRDAVFDSWAWGASIATPDKVEKTLSLYRNGNAFDINEFSSAASRGRAVTGLGAFTFVVIQAVAYGCLFVAPALRVFFDIDVGFGELGQCDGTCNSLF
eukprot:scaffold6789_cov217-Chaetoceros_neogracile.AAC.4